MTREPAIDSLSEHFDGSFRGAGTRDRPRHVEERFRITHLADVVLRRSERFLGPVLNKSAKRRRELDVRGPIRILLLDTSRNAYGQER